MVRFNRTRMDYLERFQRVIDEYNSGSVNVEELFSRLMTLAKGLTEEEQCAVSEQLSEEALFDLLTKPEMQLAKKEPAQIKKTARDSLATLKHEKLGLDWRRRQRARAQVRVTIETVLEKGLCRGRTRRRCTGERAIWCTSTSLTATRGGAERLCGWHPKLDIDPTRPCKVS